MRWVCGLLDEMIAEFLSLDYRSWKNSGDVRLLGCEIEGCGDGMALKM